MAGTSNHVGVMAKQCSGPFEVTGPAQGRRQARNRDSGCALPLEMTPIKHRVCPRAAAVHMYGVMLRDTGDLAAAEPLLREALEVTRQTLGSRHPDTLCCISSLGALLKKKGEVAAAEPLLRQVLEARREAFGDRHPHTLISINRLGQLLQEKGDFAGAEPLLREVRDEQRSPLCSSQHVNTLASIKDVDLLPKAQRPAPRATSPTPEALVHPTAPAKFG